MKNSTFSDNVADNGYGCAILFFESTNAVIKNSLFSNNLGSGASMGFVIYCDVTVFNSTFNDKGYSRNRDSFVNNQIYISGGDSFSNPEFINISFNDVKNQSFRIAEEGCIDIGPIEPDDLIIRKEVDFTMSVDDIVVGDDLIVDFNISSDIEQRDEYYGYAAGDITILRYDDESGDYVWAFDDYFYFKNNNITVPALPSGSYVVCLHFSGDKYYFPKRINQSFIVYPADYNMTGNKSVLNVSFEKTSDENSRLCINLSDIDGNPLNAKEVFIKINGVTYKRTTDDKGFASIAVNLGMEGDFSAVVSFKGDGVYLPSTEIATISIPFTVHCDIFMSKYCGEPQPFVASFLDYDGDYLSEGKATFNINGVFYTRNIDWNGQAKLNINLHPGNYTITATNPVTGVMRSCWIEILPTITDNHDLVKYYRNDSQYVVKLQGENIAGQKVTFNINGVFYERYSNDDGFVKLNINLPPNDYIITAEFNGCRVSNNISVLPVLEAKDLKMSYKDGSKFNATLVDGQGNPYAGQIVTFNINGVFYERTTDENGVARLNINLMAGESIITSTYNGNNIANKITIV